MKMFIKYLFIWNIYSFMRVACSGMAGNILWHFNLSDGRYLILCTLYFEENVDKIDIFLESF